MSTQKDSLPLLNSLFRDTPYNQREEIVKEIKKKVNSIKDNTKLIYLSITLPISKTSFTVEICTIRLPPVVQVSRDWVIKINIVSTKEIFDSFTLFQDISIEKEASPRTQLLLAVADSEKFCDVSLSPPGGSGISSGEEKETIITASGALMTRKVLDKIEETVDIESIKRPIELQLGDFDNRRKEREERWVREIETTPRIVTLALPPSNYSSPRKEKEKKTTGITHCIYASTMEDVASLWCDNKSPLFKKEMNFDNSELRGSIIYNLYSLRAIHILDAIARVRTVLMCEQTENLKQFIGTIILERNVIRDLAPTVTPNDIKKRIFDEKIISIIDVRELKILCLKPTFLLSLIPIQPKWCINCSCVRLVTQEKERYFYKYTETTLLKIPINNFETALSLNDIYASKFLIYTNFTVFDTEVEANIMLGELKQYIKRHNLLTTSPSSKSPSDELTEISLL